jgi:glycosyltransferase involved in cell wall biosynthesis
LLGLLLKGEISLALGMVVGFLRNKRRLFWNKVVERICRKDVVKFVDDYHRLEMAKAPILSVIIPHVNYARFLNDSLKSVLNSTLKNFEVIVIESGSDQENLNELNWIRESITDKRVHFDIGERRRLGANRNLGVTLAQSEIFICSFDPDDMMNPEYLELALFNSVRNALDISGASARVIGLESGIWLVEKRLEFRDFLFRNPLASNAIFTRKIWELAGGFVDSDENEPQIHEDWRFWQRASLLGARIGNITKPLVTIRIHGKNMSRDSKFLPESKISKLIREKNADVLISRHRFKHRVSSPRKRISYRAMDRDLEILGKLTRGPEDNLGKHILFFIPWLDVSGGTKVTLKVADHLADLGYRVTIVTTEDRPEYTQPLTTGHEIFNLPDILESDIWLDFVKYLIYSRETKIVWQVGSAWLYENVELLSRPGLSFIDSLFIPYSNHMRHSAALSKYFSHVLVESEVSGSAYRAIGGTAKVVVSPNGVEIPPKTTDQSPEKRTKVIFLGRLAPEKNPHAFLDVVEILQKQNHFSDYEFVIAGDGQLADSLIAYSAKKSLRVSFYGHVTETTKLLEETRLLILTSTQAEGRPNVLLEASACGVPVVAFDVGAVGDIISDAESGFLVEEGDIQTAANFATLLMGDEFIWKSMSLKAQERARLELSWAKSLSNLSEIINSL